MNKEQKEKINRAFRELRKAYYTAKQNVDTGTMEDVTQRYVYSDIQDVENADARGKLWLSWSGNGAEIHRVIEDVGLNVSWNGDPNFKMAIILEVK